MRTCALLTLALLMVGLAPGQANRPRKGYVPDASTAAKVAEAVLIPVYGKEQIESEKPLAAKLKDDVWTVSGTLHCLDRKGAITTLCDGGVAEVQISKVDAHVISMTHGR